MSGNGRRSIFLAFILLASYLWIGSAILAGVSALLHWLVTPPANRPGFDFAIYASVAAIVLLALLVVAAIVASIWFVAIRILIRPANKATLWRHVLTAATAALILLGASVVLVLVAGRSTDGVGQGYLGLMLAVPAAWVLTLPALAVAFYRHCRPLGLEPLFSHD
ncbi:hypothetical protein JI749_06060 [Devosia oryziradicis]|uniref:DUF2975 domain-containing protein n=1 Tax=Devosia oryziradicis TaxID=2801335 RepID=A0ABX7BYX7_9HYPH|nr:hypothetical protein [Devosia oryziradicis]QQR37173.1 hypothetical protein JI749_06060 [Devosia oryziradicis]